MKLRKALWMAAIAAQASAGPASADPLEAGKHTVDGGGVSFVSAGAFALGGSIGQPDAGSLIQIPFVLVGGFWGGSAGSTVSVGGEDPSRGPGAAPPAPLALRIHAAAPNPTAGSARLDLELPRPLPVRVRIYDVRGALVRTLIERELPAGLPRLAWDGRDDAGQTVGLGLYFLHVEAGSVRNAQKIVVVR
jgi:hypothetical protein